MRAVSLLLAAALGVSAAGCSHSQQAATTGAPAVAANGVKHLVRPVELSPELSENSIPSVFEQIFCSAMFQLNEKQVICADEVRAFMAFQREQVLLGKDALSVQQVANSMAAPRAVSMRASLDGDKRILISAVVVDTRNATLGRFQTYVAGDGKDLTERARELAAQIVGLPK